MNYNRKIALVFIWFMIYSIISLEAQTVCHCTIPIDNTFAIAPMTQGATPGVAPLYENNNAATPAIALPFHFCFYGQNYDSVYISNNGIVTFDQPIYRFIDSGQSLPFGADTLMVAPFYANANTLNNSGLVYYKKTANYLIVIWDSVRYAGTDVDGWNTFQLIMTNGQDPILPAGNNVSFCYPVMQWSCSDSSGGFSGYGGVPAIIGINKGDGVTYAQMGTYNKPGNAFFGPFSPDNGVESLDFESFTFNTCITGDTIAPVIYGYTAWNSTRYICPCDTTATESALGAADNTVCDTVSITGAFICAEPGQNATLSYSFAGPMYVYAVDTSTTNYIDSITVRIIPAYSDTGTQTLTLTATDPVSHMQSSVTYTIVVTTNCLADTAPVTPPTAPFDTTGIVVLDLNNSFSIFPNPASNSLTIKLTNVPGITAVKLYDVLGAEVYTDRLTSRISDIDVSVLPKCMYFIKLFEGQYQTCVRKIIIQ